MALVKLGLGQFVVEEFEYRFEGRMIYMKWKG